MGRGTGRELLDDTRGAVMVTGLVMALCLVGALWFVMGIGDACIFRDRMQEAADHAAFTSAALQAKGMNFISALNLVLLALLAIHMVLGILHDISLVACGVTILFGGFGCGAWKAMRSIWKGYFSALKPVATGIHLAQKGAAIGYPWLGTVKAFKVGETYGKQGHTGDIDVFALGATNFGEALIPDEFANSGRHGLPVKSSKMSFGCQRIGSLIVEKALVAGGFNLDKVRAWYEEGIVGDIVGLFTDMPDDEEIVKKASGIIGKVPAYRYCNALEEKEEKKKGDETADRYEDAADEAKKKAQKEAGDGNDSGVTGDMLKLLKGIDPGFDDFWGKEGFMLSTHGNGDFVNQVYALNLMPTFTDQNDRRVKIASRDYSGGVPEEGPAFGYFAQAELYFDCDQKWDEDHCNGAEDYEQHAMFRLKWRARLRRINLPKLSEYLADKSVEAIAGSKPFEQITDALGDNRFTDALEDKGKIGKLGAKGIKAAIDLAVEQGKKIAKDQAEGALESVNPETPGVWH